MVEADSKAEESSFKNTTTIDDALVTKWRKISAGLFRERWEEIEIIKRVRLERQDCGNVCSDDRIGPYHHLWHRS